MHHWIKNADLIGAVDFIDCIDVLAHGIFTDFPLRNFYETPVLNYDEI